MFHSFYNEMVSSGCVQKFIMVINIRWPEENMHEYLHLSKHIYNIFRQLQSNFKANKTLRITYLSLISLQFTVSLTALDLRFCEHAPSIIFFFLIWYSWKIHLFQTLYLYSFFDPLSDNFYLSWRLHSAVCISCFSFLDIIHVSLS